MTPESLRQLIDSGETLDVEFKGEERQYTGIIQKYGLIQNILE